MAVKVRWPVGSGISRTISATRRGAGVGRSETIPALELAGAYFGEAGGPH